MGVGIKIHHNELRNCTLVIAHPGDASTGRKPKDYFVPIDSEGNSLVSETVWMRLEQARESGVSPHTFFIIGDTENPPPINLGFGMSPTAQQQEVYRQMQDAIEEIAPPGVQPRIIEG